MYDTCNSINVTHHNELGEVGEIHTVTVTCVIYFNNENSIKIWVIFYVN